MNENTVERIVPSDLAAGEITGVETLRLHMERYQFALENIPGGRVLDIACGVGYGANHLAREGGEKIHEVVGVDNSPFAINYGNNHYAHPKIKFVLGDAYAFKDAAGFDAVVSLETIEHLPEVERFISAVVSLIRPGGRWICSVPVTPTMDAIPFHLHDFTPRSFRRLFSGSGLVEINHMLQVQKFDPLTVLKKKEKRMENLRPGILKYYLLHPGAAWKRFFSTIRYGFENHYLTIVWEKK